MFGNIENRKIEPEKEAWFFFICLYIIFDYGRPQTVLPVISNIKPSMILILLLSFFLITRNAIFKIPAPQIRYLWLFVVLLGCYIPFAKNGYYAYKTTLAQMLYLPFTLSMIFCLDSINRLKKLVFLFIILMAYVSIYSLTHGGKGPGNYFTDENDLSLYLNTWIPFCYFLFFKEKRKVYKYIYLFAAIVGVMAVVTSFSRGGFVGLLAICFAVWTMSKKK